MWREVESLVFEVAGSPLHRTDDGAGAVHGHLARLLARSRQSEWTMHKHPTIAGFARVNIREEHS